MIKIIYEVKFKSKHNRKEHHKKHVKNIYGEDKYPLAYMSEEDYEDLADELSSASVEKGSGVIGFEAPPFSDGTKRYIKWSQNGELLVVYNEDTAISLFRMPYDRFCERAKKDDIKKPNSLRAIRWLPEE